MDGGENLSLDLKRYFLSIKNEKVRREEIEQFIIEGFNRIVIPQRRRPLQLPQLYCYFEWSQEDPYDLNVAVSNEFDPRANYRNPLKRMFFVSLRFNPDWDYENNLQDNIFKIQIFADYSNIHMEQKFQYKSDVINDTNINLYQKFYKENFVELSKLKAIELPKLLQDKRYLTEALVTQKTNKTIPYIGRQIMDFAGLRIPGTFNEVKLGEDYPSVLRRLHLARGPEPIQYINDEDPLIGQNERAKRRRLQGGFLNKLFSYY